MSCYLHYRFEYRGGFVVEGKSADHPISAREALDQRVALMERHGVPYIVEGLALTYDDVQGARKDLHRTVTLTWTDQATEEA